MSEAKVEIFSTLDDLIQSAAVNFIAVCSDAIKERGRFTVALSGGQTPKPLHYLLTKSGQIDWSKVYVFWGDERCVPPDHQDSNYGMAFDMLLSHVPLEANQIFRMRGEIPPQEAAVEYQHALVSFFGGQLPRFDLMIQGMGADGHTASLFPHNAALHVQDQWVIAPHVDKLDAWRITLTTPVINNAHNIMFMVTGADKAPALLQVLRGESNPDQYPAQLIKPAEGEILWLVDQAAAELL
jgi:6-phosphogluconolactonase